MVKKNFFWGTLVMVLALIFGFVLMGCKTDGDDSGGKQQSGGGGFRRQKAS